MKAVVISKWFPTPYAPGSGVFVLEQLKALRRQGVEVTLVLAPTPWAPRWLRFLPRVRKYNGIPKQSVQAGFQVAHPRVLNFPSDRLFFLYGLFFYLRCRRFVRRLVKEQKIDLIHAHTIMPEGFAAVLLGREFGLPVVCTIHGGDVNDLLPPFKAPSKRRLALGALKWALKNSRHLITVSSELKRKAESLAENRQIQVTVARNGADSEIFKPRDKSEARKMLALPLDQSMVLFVGGLVGDKGLPFLLDGFAAVRRPYTRLYLVGAGSKEAELRQQSRALGIESACVFVGAREHSEIPLWLASCDCFVLPSVTEGSPTIISEAMLCRTPVVATEVGGVPELIRHGETGLLAPSKNPIALGHAIEFMLANSDAALHMAHMAEIHARTNLTWEANARKTMEVYRAAVDKNTWQASVEFDYLEQS